MRWFGGLIIVGLCGCTALNGDYGAVRGDTDDAAGSTGTAGRPDTGDPTRPDAGSDSASGGVTTSMDSAPSVETSATSGTSDSHGTEETGWAGSTTWAGGSTETGKPPAEHVAIVYSVPGWAGTEATQNTFENATTLCTEALLPECDKADPPFPLLRFGDMLAAGFLAEISKRYPLPVVGPDGTFLADDGLDLFTLGPAAALEEAGVDPHKGDSFWSGGLEGLPNNCNNWSASTAGEPTGTVGSFSATDTWFDDGLDPCDVALPILCACTSIPDPFPQ